MATGVMATGQRFGSGRLAAAGLTVAGVVGLGLLTAPAGAGAAPELPPVTAEELVASILDAEPGAFDGTVELDNALGLPALPAVPQAADGTSSARIWSDGQGRGRVQIPTDSGERTLVADGETFWVWNSEDRTVIRTDHDGEHSAGAGPELTDPGAAATAAIAALQESSIVTVDGTAEVAGRPAYELVLAPAPEERTLLREVRVAVDAEQRVPLRFTVLANGSPDPVLQIGFTELEFGPQDPALFTFIPPPGSTVEEPGDRPAPDLPDRDALAGAAPSIVGDGWDTVLVAAVPTGDGAERPPDLAQFGVPVSGPWGSGTLFSTAVANAILTDDGRVAVGAVPEQVLTEALSR